MEYNLNLNYKRLQHIAILSLVSLLGFVLAACNPTGDELDIGDQAPSFTLPSEVGEQVSLVDYRGKQPVLLYFHMAVG
jgi:hypothetical protein